ncbi:MAG: hypothetical protein ABH816_03435 [Candidatus Levyibacteriota bacterium]
MRYLKTFWKKWKYFAKIVTNFQAQVIFTLFYFLILWMVGFIFRLISDPLKIKNKSLKSSFSRWEHPNESLEEARKPY